MKVSIVIPNWNGEEKLKKHLPQVIKAARTSHAEEIIVVDDASSDNSIEILRTKFPDVNYIKKEKNSGFSTTVNIGFKQAKGDLIALLNSDAHPNIDFIENTLVHFKNPRVFGVGCNVGGLWAGAKFTDGFFWHNQTPKNGNDKLSAHQTLWVSGGTGVFRKKIWDELDGLDELFNPFYEEDVDIGYRATKRGFINIWEPKSIVEHYKEEGVISQHFSQKSVSLVAERNQLWFIWKNITDQEFMKEHKVALLKMLSIHPKYWQVFLAAVLKFPEIMKKRQIEKKHAKLTDKEILAIFANP